MELGGVDVVAPDGGREFPAVFGAGRDDGFVRGLGKEAVDEVEVGAVRDAAEEGAVGSGEFDLVPADLWDLEVGFGFGGLEADDGTLEDAEAEGAGVEFLAPFKEGLVTDADAEERPAVGNPFLNASEEFLTAECVDAVVEGADAGQDDAGGAVESMDGIHALDVGTDGPEGLLDAADVSGAVIEER